MQSTFTAFFDSNVFFGVRLRSFILWTAQSGLFRARWSRRVHDEWIAAVVRRRPNLTAERLEPIAAQMDRAVPDSVVGDYESLIAGLTLPDPGDRHVVAAAIVARADAIVTFNLGDFPDADIARFGLHARHPDDFFLDLEGIAAGLLARAAASDLAHYRDPPLMVDQSLADLAKAGVPRLAAYLGELRVLLEAPQDRATP